MEMENLRDEMSSKLNSLKWDMENARGESVWKPPPGYIEKLQAGSEWKARCQDNRNQPVTVPDSWTPNPKC